ncbi:MAG: hypothetical protein FJX80_09555 [Bacteroidetes bacterium]|nr:hypothetical protein [Bacteroidota bacterium]
MNLNIGLLHKPLRVIAALYAGSIINMCFVWLGNQWFPAPADLKNVLPLHYLFPLWPMPQEP